MVDSLIGEFGEVVDVVGVGWSGLRVNRAGCDCSAGFVGSGIDVAAL